MSASNPKEWSARWVWIPDDDRAANSHTYFRSEIVIAKPASNTLFISAHSRYRLWINGALIADGPPSSTADAIYYDTHDITDRLRVGTNCVAVDVRFVGGLLEVQESIRRPGLLVEIVGSDGKPSGTGLCHWRCQRGSAWLTDTVRVWPNIYDPYQEIFDARVEPPGWREIGFDDSSWRVPLIVDLVNRASERRENWPTTSPSPIPNMSECAILAESVVAVDECMSLANRPKPNLAVTLSQAGRPLTDARADFPSRLVTGGAPAILGRSDRHLRDRTVDGIHDPCVLLDFGREHTAYIEIEVEGEAGSVVDIGMAERLVDGHFTNVIEGQFAARYILREGRQRWRTSAWRGFRYVRIRLSAGTKPVKFHTVAAVETRYPFEQLGQFNSSEMRLEQIFTMCRDTVQLCCTDAIVDTPWREQAQWLGDASAVTLRGIYACFGDTALPAKFLRQAASTRSGSGLLQNISNVESIPPEHQDSPDIPDFTLWWLIALLEYYRYSGDIALLEELFGSVFDVTELFLALRNERGLVRSFGFVLIDWADIDRAGECAPLNAILHGALRSSAEVARILGYTHEADRWRNAADELRAAFLPRFWCNAAGALADSVHDDGIMSDFVSEHANFSAIRFGLLKGALAHRVVQGILVDRTIIATEAQPFFTSVVLDALADMGRMDLALDVVRDRWGARMLDRGATSCYEEWGINGSWRNGTFTGFMRSLSHAWSAHPAAFLITRLAGIEIVEAGCRRLHVAPPQVGLDVDVCFPTPSGAVRVRVRGSDVTVDAPDAISVTLDRT